MSAAKYPAFRDNTTFWEGKRIAFTLSGDTKRGEVEAVTHSHRNGVKEARAVVRLDRPYAFLLTDTETVLGVERVIIWPDHLDAVYPLFEP